MLRGFTRLRIALMRYIELFKRVDNDMLYVAGVLTLDEINQLMREGYKVASFNKKRIRVA